MDTVTKEVYREYLCTRMKQLTEHMMNLPAGNDTLKLHLEIQRDMDFVMQQLWIIDNREEECFSAKSRHFSAHCRNFVSVLV